MNMYSPKPDPQSRCARSSFTCIGATLLTIGIICVLLSFITIGVSVSAYQRCAVDHLGENDFIATCGTVMSTLGYMLALSPAGVVSGVMYIIAGSIGIGAGKSKASHRQSGLKFGFMVLCIINALFFTWGLFIGAIALSTIMNLTMNGAPGAITAVSVINCLLSLTVFILSIVGASISCCCAPVGEEKVMTVMHPTTGIRSDDIVLGTQLSGRDTVNLVNADQLQNQA